MTFRIVNGGNKTGHSQEQAEARIKILVAQMRQIEYMIATTKRAAQKMRWDELDEKLVVCHKEILATLGFVKRTSKYLKLKQTKPSISLVVDNRK